MTRSLHRKSAHADVLDRHAAAIGWAAAGLQLVPERVASLDEIGRVAGTRELVVPGTPYVIPYRLRTDRLEIIAIFHGRQKWPGRR